MKRVTRAVPGLLLRLVGLNLLACASQDGVTSTKPGQMATASTGDRPSIWVDGGIDVPLGSGGAAADCVDALVPPNSGMGAAGAGEGDSGVCGCDGNVYSSADEAKAAASGVDEYGYCHGEFALGRGSATGFRLVRSFATPWPLADVVHGEGAE